ncbi:acetyltransferase [Streptococcus suis]|uniref:acetyltransferase n=1 Tax=Streptococcus suis TaxID=1307 RepID=UPI001BA819C6|nr:acetyltransferase [Streptococcus suis]MBS0755177.1 acetyltransferase [Streptococcus suis]MCH1744500.1 acetyltransferase [Streptococcus suis]
MIDRGESLMKKVAFLGAGTFSDGVLPWLDRSRYELIGYFEDKPISDYRGYPVFGPLQDVLTYLDDGKVDAVFVTIGDNVKRKEIFDLLAKDHYDALFNIISEQANIFSPDSIKGRGVFIGFSSFVGADSYVYDNCIINTGAIVEHHTTVEAHCNITPGVTINGLCRIGEGTYIGSGSTVIQCIEIAPYTTLGAGTVVLKSLTESGTYVGVPARNIK